MRLASAPHVGAQSGDAELVRRTLTRDGVSHHHGAAQSPASPDRPRHLAE